MLSDGFWRLQRKEKAMEASNVKAMHDALKAINCINTHGLNRLLWRADIFDGGLINKTISMVEKARCALSAPPRKGKWENGTMYEHEYAYCSECGRMQWAGWDSHKEAENNIESFANDYKFCPGCGAEMGGGLYVK